MIGRGSMANAPKFGRTAKLPLILLCAGLFASPRSTTAQGIRGWVGTSVQMVDVRPLGLDTVSLADVIVTGDGRYLYQGQAVDCVRPDVCTGYIAMDKDRTVAATQDVSLTAWGFGVQGLSFTTLLRARAHAGGDFAWPRSGDAFDALLGYAQLLRGPFRIRAGRQEVRSGLGFPAFDGASVTYDRGMLQGQLYGGRSLARGLREPSNDALKGLGDYFIDESAYLFGAAVKARWSGTVLTTRYHREILSDRSSLVGERASLDFVSIFPRVRISGSADYDFSFQQVGKGHLTLSAPLDGGRWLIEITGRRYVPYFQLSTIWGYFNPVSYTEALLRVGWSPAKTLGVWASGGRRTYEDTNTEIIFDPLTDHGWRANAGARWQAAPDWSVNGSYRLEWGPGGFLNSGDVAVRYASSDRLSLSVSGMSFQQIDEFRVGEGRAFGGGLSFDLRVDGRTSLSGGMSILRHRDGGNVFTSPWNQSRGWTSLRVAVGEDPGLANRRNRR